MSDTRTQTRPPDAQAGQPQSAQPPRDKLINLLLRVPDALAMRVRLAALRAMGLQIDGNAWVRRVDIPRNPWDIRLGRGAMLDQGVVLLTTGQRRGADQGGPRIRIGPGVYINRFTMIDASERIEIGDRTMIGPHCYITDHDHGIVKSDVPIPKQPLYGAPTVIEPDAWLGAGVTLLKGVTIGRGAVVAAGAVVRESVEPWAIVGGVPSRVLGHRQEA